MVNPLEVIQFTQAADYPAPIALLARHLTRKFGDFIAVNNIHLEVQRGSFFGFLGPNGAGKSTLLNIIAGELSPISGQIQPNVNLLMGHFGQTNISRLSMENTVEEEIASADTNVGIQRVRSICGTITFGPSAISPALPRCLPRSVRHCSSKRCLAAICARSRARR